MKNLRAARPLAKWKIDAPTIIVLSTSKNAAACGSSGTSRSSGGLVAERASASRVQGIERLGGARPPSSELHRSSTGTTLSSHRSRCRSGQCGVDTARVDRESRAADEVDAATPGSVGRGRPGQGRRGRGRRRRRRAGPPRAPRADDRRRAQSAILFVPPPGTTRPPPGPAGGRPDRVAAGAPAWARSPASGAVGRAAGGAGSGRAGRCRWSRGSCSPGRGRGRGPVLRRRDQCPRAGGPVVQAAGREAASMRTWRPAVPAPTT